MRRSPLLSALLAGSLCPSSLARATCSTRSRSLSLLEPPACAKGNSSRLELLVLTPGPEPGGRRVPDSFFPRRLPFSFPEACAVFFFVLTRLVPVWAEVFPLRMVHPLFCLTRALVRLVHRLPLALEEGATASTRSALPCAGTERGAGAGRGRWGRGGGEAGVPEAATDKPDLALARADGCVPSLVGRALSPRRRPLDTVGENLGSVVADREVGVADWEKLLPPMAKSHRS